MVRQEYKGMFVKSFFKKVNGQYTKRFKVYHGEMLLDDNQDSGWKAERIWEDQYGKRGVRK